MALSRKPSFENAPDTVIIYTYKRTYTAIIAYLEVLNICSQYNTNIKSVFIVFTARNYDYMWYKILFIPVPSTITMISSNPEICKMFIDVFVM